MATRNQQYFGYIPPDNPIDWAKLTGGLASTITGISEERQKQREELDKIYTDNQRVVSTVDSYSNQTLNGFVGSAASDARSMIGEWNRQLKNREITPAQYRERNNNLMTNWAAVGNTAKTFNATIQEALKRNEPDEYGNVAASGEELYKIGKLAEFGDLKNKKIFIDPQTGNLMTGVLDPATGKVDPNTLVTGVAMNNVENIQSNKVNLNQLVQNKVKNWEPYSLEEGLTTTVGKGLNPKIAMARASLVSAIINNPSTAASVIDDNSEYDLRYYSGANEKKAQINQMIAAQNDARKQMDLGPMTDKESQEYVDANSIVLVDMQRDGNGILRPVLTKDQMDLAEKIVNGEIDIQMGMKVSQDEPTKPTKPPEGDKPTDAQINAKTKGAEIKQIMSGKFSEIPEKLRDASGGQYYFKWENNAWSAYDQEPNNKGAKPKYSGLKNTAESMYKIFSTKEQEQYYKEGTKSKTITTFD
jgi:hypothetical protein